MGKIKIGLIILGSIALVGLVMAGIAMAKNDSNNGKAEYVPDEIIVKFKGDTQPFRVFKVPEGKVGEKIKEFKGRADVIYAEPNYIAYALMVPTDPYYKYQWHLDNSVYGGIGMEEAWDISTGQGVTVAVVDTGIRKGTDLANTCFVSGYDFVNNDTDPTDDNSHGTHVAGTIAQSTNNTLGVAGVAFNSCLMPVKVLSATGSGTYAQVANGIYYAANNGAKVINLSLGGSSDSTTLKDAVAYAYGKGVAVIAAAGNENSTSILYPAAYNDYVIAVGATQYDETKAPYSNYGPSLDLVAPGGNTSLDQNKDGYADGVLQQTFTITGKTISWAYYFFQGTSMATPHVSGVAALLIANGNATTTEQIRTALQKTAECLPHGGTCPNNTYGYGLVNAYAALQWTAGQPPVVSDIPDITFLEDSSNSSLDLDNYVTDPDNTPAEITWTYSGNTNVIVSIDSLTHVVTLTAVANWNGSESITFTATDPKGLSDSDVSLVTVTPVNDPPVANDQSVTTNEDTAVAIALTATDVDGDSLIYTVVTDPTNGSLTGIAPNLTHTPNANYNGSDSFTFKVNDGKVDSNTATVSITVNAVNDPPVANDQSVTTNEETAVAITLIASDVENDPLTYSVVTNPTNGTLSGTAPNLTYTPNLNFNGSDSFTFKANDGKVDSNIATVSITINPVNDPPVANNQSVATEENTAVSITLTGSDVDGDALTFAIVTNPSNGSLTLDPSFSTNGKLTHTPNSNYIGADSFTFTVSDSTLTSDPAIVSITVTEVNNPPVADDQSVTTNEDTSIVITLTATDVDGDSLIYTVVTDPTNGSLTGIAPNLTYTPNANYNGSDSFTFNANDGKVDSNTAIVSITVNAVNDPPVANDQSVATNEDTAVAITLIASDVENDPLAYSVVTNPTNGTLSGTAPNLTYTPNLNFNGSDSFTFKANDGKVDSNIATVSITINPVNDPPVANDQSVATDEDTVVAITLSATDLDSDPLTYTVVTNPANGTLSGTAPNLAYTPNSNFNGLDSFTFKVNDGQADSNIATVSITVNPVNDAPVANDQSVTTTENTSVNIILTASDVDGDALTYSIVAYPSHGTLSGTAPNVTYTPGTGYTGLDNFTFKANDGTVDSNIATISITVNPVAQKMHVGDILMSGSCIYRGPNAWCKAAATVSILDSFGGVFGATVSGSWSGVYSASVSGTTNGDGEVTFATNSVKGGGTFTFTVSNVTKEGWVYDSTANFETSDSIILH